MGKKNNVKTKSPKNEKKIKHPEKENSEKVDCAPSIPTEPIYADEESPSPGARDR